MCDDRILFNEFDKRVSNRSFELLLFFFFKRKKRKKQINK
jgi:hypothetical protein